MFIAALFTIAKLWQQPRCPTTDEWIKKMWYLYTMVFYSAMKKNEISPFTSQWMELENIILSEVRLRKPKIICSPSYVDFRSRANKYSNVIGLWSHDKARAHKGGMRIGKKPKKT
jgi:hypothetical protein